MNSDHEPEYIPFEQFRAEYEARQRVRARENQKAVLSGELTIEELFEERLSALESKRLRARLEAAEEVCRAVAAGRVNSGGYLENAATSVFENIEGALSAWQQIKRQAEGK